MPTAVLKYSPVDYFTLEETHVVFNRSMNSSSAVNSTHWFACLGMYSYTQRLSDCAVGSDAPDQKRAGSQRTRWCAKSTRPYAGISPPYMTNPEGLYHSWSGCCLLPRDGSQTNEPYRVMNCLQATWLPCNRERITLHSFRATLCTVTRTPFCFFGVSPDLNLTGAVKALYRRLFAA